MDDFGLITLVISIDIIMKITILLPCLTILIFNPSFYFIVFLFDDHMLSHLFLFCGYIDHYR